MQKLYFFNYSSQTSLDDDSKNQLQHYLYHELLEQQNDKAVELKPISSNDRFEIVHGLDTAMADDQFPKQTLYHTNTPEILKHSKLWQDIHAQ